MDFESPDVEKDFPGLYASESGRKSNESDFSDGGDHDKPSKKDLLGRRKEKKESKKDRGYAALEGESSPEEDTDTKSPSKSKKTKSFKFPTKSKEKREKSRDKEKVLEEAAKHKEHNEKEKKKEKEREKEREREKKEKEKKEKLKEKDKVKEKEEKAKFKLESKEKLKDEKKDKTKDKDKEKVKSEKEKEKSKEKEKDKVKEKEKDKVKEKDKDKKDKKLIKVPSTVTSGVPFEEIFTLGVALPIFGVPLQQSVERSRCHDDTGLPLVVRDSIDYLQAHGLKSPLIYRAEPDKIKLQQLRKLFTDRGPTFPYHWDVPVACAMLKAFISELPESILTQELHGQFEQATAISEPQREATMSALVNKLPANNYSLVGWLVRHFENVISNEQVNHANIQTISTSMGAALNMSLNLLTYLVTKSEKLFPDVVLTKYEPPLPSLPAEFPGTAAALSCELRKQESLLSQIHAEMHAGFSTPARDHQLWEAQRIVTQLKRKLRAVQKSCEPSTSTQQPSFEEKPDDEVVRRNSQQETTQTDGETKTQTPIDAFQEKESPNLPDPTFEAEFEDNFENNFEFKPETNFEFKPEANFEFKPEANFEFKPESNFEFKPETDFEFKPDPNFDFKPDSDFDFQPESKFEFESDANFEFIPESNFEFSPEADFEFKPEKNTPDQELPPPSEPVQKPKFTEEELKILKLELENAEYLQLKSLLQAKINSEQFEIVKLRSHMALKSKELQLKESKEVIPPEDNELKQRLIKENAMLEQKRLNLINQIFQERVACIQLKIELAMKEIMSK